ncbi:invasin domain 3-containing protein [Brevibacillus reuszeri]|uniref:invasin domain 3-containing protein n=1 Tax=Brevibacillus reuszeri TaxID=54915 RepID=UPI0028987289|nr:invasin domain 3-containing protein [Brevibacillus reuszeri]
MKKKQLALSVLSTALVASMAASAFAAPKAGVYIGGNVDKYYSFKAMGLNMDTFLDEMINTVPDVLYVSQDGEAKGGNLAELLFVSNPKSHFVDVTTQMANDIGGEGGFYAVNEDGTVSTEKSPFDDKDPGIPGELKVESVSAITKTELKVQFNKAVDAAVAANFKIPGLNVESASLDAAKKVVTIKVSGAEARKTYELTVTGIKVGGTTIDDIKKSFEVPAATELFKLHVAAADQVIKADGASKTLITFDVKDAAGNELNTGDIEVAFSTTHGTLAERRVTVQNGKATVLLTSEFLTSDANVNIIAQIVEAADKDLIGLKTETNVVFSPNPDVIIPGVKPVVTGAGASQADRVVVYFNKDVQLDYFIDKNGALNPGVGFEVYSNVPNSGDLTGLDKVDVKGVLPVPGNNQALILVLDKNDANNDFPLVDNSNIFVKLVDGTNGVSQESKAPLFKLTDARQPAALSVQVQDLRTLVVTFSESLDDQTVTTYENWSIDGVKLDSTKYDISIGDFVPNAQGGADTRHVVTIKKKVGYFEAGSHSIQASKIGDWASRTDKLNIANTQTLDFNVVADESVPTATVEVQSPEQWLLDFNVAVEETGADAKTAIELQVWDDVSKVWKAVTATTIGNAADLADLADLKVTKVADTEDKFLVETQIDWTKVYKTSTSGKNYFNDKYRLHIAAETFTNVANGKQNVIIDLPLNGQMLTPDLTSPSIVDVKEVVAGTTFKAILSEPVKLPVLDPNDPTKTKQETLAEKQTALPVPTAEFIAKGNSETITATVAPVAADPYDYELTITPDKPLTAGEWTLVIRSISDDIGNTAASISKKFTVEGTAPGADVFKVVWAFADVDTDLIVEDVDAADADVNHDYIFVTFSSAISTTGDFKNVLKTSNYTIDGKDLPIGSQIVADIPGYTDATPDVVDSITIILPQGTLNGKNAPHVLNISKYLENKKGTKISGDLQLKLAYNITNLGTPVDFTGLNTAITAAQTKHDNSVEGVLPGQYALGSKAAFQTAINTANAVKNNPNSTQAQVNAAETALTTAEATFEAGKVPTAVVDFTVLTTAINAAQAKHAGATEGAANGNYAVGSKATFQAAIDAANVVKNDPASTQAQVDAAVTALAAADTAFEAGKVVVDTTALATAVSDAQAKHDAAVEGTNPGEYAAGSKATFQTAIDAAEAVKNDPASTQAQVDAAVAALATAEATFDSAIS